MSIHPLPHPLPPDLAKQSQQASIWICRLYVRRQKKEKKEIDMINTYISFLFITYTSNTLTLFLLQISITSALLG